MSRSPLLAIATAAVLLAGCVSNLVPGRGGGAWKPDAATSTQFTGDLSGAKVGDSATYATEASREVAQWCHLAAGTTAIREGSRLERAFRDLYTGTQHAFISEKTYLESAQVLLGR